MFSPLFYIGLVCLFSGLIGSRILAERAMRFLVAEEKLALLDSFSRLRAYGSIPIVLVVFSFFGLSYVPVALFWPAYFSIWVILAVFLIVIHRLVFRRMRELKINLAFQRAHAGARYVSYAGFVLFFITNTVAPFVQ